jgi:cytochrome c oxidase cbb3-type subunit 3
MNKGKTEDQVLSHDYDGIQEYDNSLPGWWLLTFYATIIFAFIYYVHYEIAGGPTLRDELKVEMSLVQGQQASAPQGVGETEEQLAALMSAPKVLENGKAVFVAKCVACHLAEGQGLVGPNLTDAYWIHGKGTRVDIINVVRKGVPEKGMLSWETLISKDEIISVVAYVYSLKGTNPPNPKAPQGVKVE